MRNNRGMTLIEVIIVIVIVAILASVAVPLIEGVRMKMMAAEAITTLGMIRVAQQLYFNKYKAYTTVMGLEGGGYLSQDSLNGVYFSYNCYERATVTFPTINRKYALCMPYYSNPDDSPKANEVNRVWCGQTINGYSYIAIDADSGNYYSDIPGLGYGPKTDWN